MPKQTTRTVRLLAAFVLLGITCLAVGVTSPVTTAQVTAAEQGEQVYDSAAALTTPPAGDARGQRNDPVLWRSSTSSGDLSLATKVGPDIGQVARRHAGSADRVPAVERALTPDGGLNVSRTVAGQLSRGGGRDYIPNQSILDTLGSGARAPDPQGVAGQFLYRSSASFNGRRGQLEVLQHEGSGQIRHVLFRSGG